MERAVVYSSNPSTWKVQMGDTEVQDHHQLHREFEAILDYETLYKINNIKILMTTEAMGNWIKYLNSFFRSWWLLTFGVL